MAKIRVRSVENISKKGPQISPLRCAPVEMTKGRVVPPSTVVAEQEPFFITLGGPKAYDSSVEDKVAISTLGRNTQVSKARPGPPT